MKRNFIKAISFVSLFAIFACSEDAIVEHTLDNGVINKVSITGADFKNEDGTRSSVSIGESGASFTWSENDTVGIFPNKGSQAEFAMSEGVGTQTATFSGGGWALKSSATYSAYYPYNFYNRDMTKIPVSYVGQTQNGNNNTDHIGAYDFMAASVATPSNGAVAFDMQHLGCLVQLKIDLLEEAGIGNVSIKYGSSYNAMFTTAGHVDLTSATPQVNPSGDKSSSLDIKLNNLRVKADETAVIYFMMAPVNMEGKTIDIAVTEDNGFTRTFQVAGKNFVAGKAYSYSMALSKDNVAEVTVKTAGTFFDEVYNHYGNSSQITDLKIIGPLNGTDIKLLRTEFANLVSLDMSEVDIVAGGGSYYTNENNTVQNTSANTFPAYFMTQSNLTKLESIILPNSVTTIPHGSFVDVFNGGDKPISTYKLTKVVLGENLAEIGEIVFGCSMKSIHIPASVTSIGGAAFGYCPYLETITVDEQNTAFKSHDGVLYWKETTKWVSGKGNVPAYTVCCCPSTKTSIDFPDDILIYGVLYRSFSDCVHLTEIELPEGVEYIGAAAFARCTALEKVTIPSTMTVNQSYGASTMFYDNPAMKELHLNTATPPQWYINTGTASKSYLPTTCKLYVPYTDGWSSSSANRSNWSRYFSINYKYN
ncbi:MAG: leucine-rich repeat protein [Bacteroidaceae bacterium]|nr:leucine-rich repeat protein [Bacteroidaceae bacterium]